MNSVNKMYINLVSRPSCADIVILDNWNEEFGMSRKALLRGSSSPHRLPGSCAQAEHPGKVSGHAAQKLPNLSRVEPGVTQKA